jgi:hypothetical protein
MTSAPSSERTAHISGTTAAELEHLHAVQQQVASAAQRRCCGRKRPERRILVDACGTANRRRRTRQLHRLRRERKPLEAVDAGVDEEATRAGLRVLDELTRLVQHAHRRAEPECFGEQLRSRAVGEPVLRQHPDHVGVGEPEVWVAPLVGFEDVGVAQEGLEARPLLR